MLTTQRDVFFLGPSKQLQKNTLLDIRVLIDGRSNCTSQSIVHIGFLGQNAQQFDTLRWEDVVFALLLLVQTFVVHFAIVHHINVSAIHRFNDTCPWILLDRNGSIDSCHCDTIAGLHFVNQIVVRKEQHVVWRLSGGHVIRSLLQFHHLLVGKLRSIVHQLETVVGVAVGAQSGLMNATTINLDGRCERTNDALEESLTHFWDDVGRSDYHAADRDQLINVLWVKGAHVACLLCVEGSHLDLVLQHSCRITFEEHLIDGHVECWNDLLRIADELAIQRFIERFQMSAVDVQERLFQSVDLIHFLHVQWLAEINVLADFILFCARINVSHQKLLEGGLAFVNGYIRAPDDQLGSGRCDWISFGT